MPKRGLYPALEPPAHLVARPVEGKWWMLYHTQFQQLLDDFGWFANRGDAEAMIARLQAITATPRRFLPVRVDRASFN